MSRNLKPRRCEVCQEELKNTEAVTVGHLSTPTTFDLCKFHHGQPDVWQPLYDVVFGQHVKQTLQANPPSTKKKKKGMVSKQFERRAINL